MSSPRKSPTLLDWLGYISARAGGGVLTYLPWKVSRALVEFLAGIFVSLQKEKRKERVVQDVRKAFPEFSRAKADKVADGAYRTVFRTVVDALQFRWHVTTDNWQHLVELKGEELLQQRNPDKGIIFASGHFGSWELMGISLGLHGYPTTTIVRPMRNPLLDRYVREMRKIGGQKVVNRNNALRHSLRELRNGRHVGFLMDQDARSDGIFVDFMGRPASTQPSLARLSVRTEAPIAFVYTRESENGQHFVVKIDDVIWPRADADEEDEIFRITQRFTKDLEKVVREAPEKWMWTENRWKTYPGKFEDRHGPRPGILNRQQTPELTRSGNTAG